MTTKRLIKIMIVLIILLLSYFILFKQFKIQNVILKQIYKTQYSEYVTKYAKENNVDEYMVYAIIKAESNFNPNVKSGSDAIGLMQLLEDTAMEMSNSIDETQVTEQELYEPETNIKLGIAYYAYLLNHYEGNNILALTAYNAGLGNVDTWIKQKIIKQDGSDIENIPYKETNNYVRKILRDYRIYINLYVEQ